MVHILLTIVQFFGVWIAVMMIAVAVREIRERIARYIARKRRARRRDWLMTLFVRVDDDGLLHPSVRLRGDPIPAKAVVVLTIVTADGREYRPERRELPPETIGIELSMPAFAPPPEMTMAEVLTARWDLEVRVGRRTVTRWGNYLSDFGGLNAEAEIESLSL
jgi:hypothetical protein